MDTVHLTRDGYEKLRRDLQKLIKEERPVATQALATAREHGDLSENAEYDAARENMADIDRRISILQQQLTRVELIENNGTLDEVRILTKVTLRDLAKSRDFTYILVDPLQADPGRNLISVKSPIGKGLLGKKIGDETTITVPSGEIRLQVVAIERSEGL